jgi:aspartate carbamoyltransferase catalytic subunit
MSEELTEQEKYISNLESLFMIAMHRLGNDVLISDEELSSIKGDKILDVVSTENGLHLRMIDDVQE